MRPIAVNFYDNGTDASEQIELIRKFCLDFNTLPDIFVASHTYEYKDCHNTRLLPYEPKNYMANVDKKAGITKLLKTNYAFWSNSLQIVQRMCEGHMYDHCLTVDTSFEDNIWLGGKLRGLVEANFLLARQELAYEYPSFFLPNPNCFISDISTMYKLCQLWKNIDYLEIQRFSWPDFLSRMNNQGIPEEKLKYYAHFLWYSWCNNQSVKVRYINNGWIAVWRPLYGLAQN